MLTYSLTYLLTNMRMGQYISSLSVAKDLTPSINNIIEAVPPKLNPVYDVTEKQMRDFLLLKMQEAGI